MALAHELFGLVKSNNLGVFKKKRGPKDFKRFPRRTSNRAHSLTMMQLVAVVLLACALSTFSLRAARGLHFAHHSARQLQQSRGAQFTSSPLLCTAAPAEPAADVPVPAAEVVPPPISPSEIKRKRDAFLKLFSNERFSKEAMGKLGLNMVLA
jgi:hypothetical protein